MSKDRVIWIGCVLLVLVGFVLGANRDLFTNIKITDWLTSIGTIGAIAVALYSNRLNLDRDRYKLVCTYHFSLIPGQVAMKNHGTVFRIDVKDLKIKTVNIGLRPIALQGFSIKNHNISMNDPLLTLKNPSTKFREGYVLQPGEFCIIDIPNSCYPEEIYDIEQCEFFVIDALGLKHKAEKKDATSFLV